MYRFLRKPVLALILAVSVIAGCATEPRTQLVSVADSRECVVLLHGLNRSWRAMKPMAESLQLAGYSTANVDYPSQSGPIEEIAPVAVGLGLEECRASGAETIHFVTHSLGGILLRYEHKRSPIKDLGRVVMLGPPNQGSELIDKTVDWPGFDSLSGAAGRQLGTGDDSMPLQLGPVDFELGVIADVYRLLHPIDQRAQSGDLTFGRPLSRQIGQASLHGAAGIQKILHHHGITRRTKFTA